MSRKGWTFSLGNLCSKMNPFSRNDSQILPEENEQKLRGGIHPSVTLKIILFLPTNTLFLISEWARSFSGSQKNPDSCPMKYYYRVILSGNLPTFLHINKTLTRGPPEWTNHSHSASLYPSGQLYSPLTLDVYLVKNKRCCAPPSDIWQASPFRIL